MVCADGIDREHQLYALLLSLFKQALCQLELVVFAEGGANFLAHCLHEGVAHAAANDDGVALVEQVGDNADLVGDLSAAQDSNERTCRIGKRLAHDGNFFIDEEAAGCGQIIGNASGGGMCAVRGAECIIYVNFCHGSELFGKSGIILFFFLVEADIFKQHDFARLECSSECLCGFANDVIRQLDILPEQL